MVRYVGMEAGSRDTAGAPDPLQPQSDAGSDGDRAADAGRALIRLGSRLHRLYAETIESLSVPLSVRQYRILERVGAGVTSLSRLAELARRQPPTISKSVDSLVRQGLLIRAEAAADRRTAALSLTPRGAALLREAHEELDRLGRWLAGAAGADPGRLAAFADSLYDQTEAELDLLVDARRPPGRAPRLAGTAGRQARQAEPREPRHRPLGSRARDPESR
jgi:DNA-binding MarR family transcriptional regulator